MNELRRVFRTIARLLQDEAPRLAAQLQALFMLTALLVASGVVAQIDDLPIEATPSYPKSDVYYVQAFRGRYFPIPTRYAFLGVSVNGDGQEWQFGSPVEGRLLPTNLPEDEWEPVGQITIWNYRTSPNYPSGPIEPVQSIQLYGLHVTLFEIHSSTSQRASGFQLVEIEARDARIRIFDQDKLLWLRLLKLYAEANGVQ